MSAHVAGCRTGLAPLAAAARPLMFSLNLHACRITPAWRPGFPLPDAGAAALP